MKLLRQACIIMGICFLGEVLHRFLHWPIPGNVLGMVLLFAGLCTGVIKTEMIKEISAFLLDHLAFFFIPAGVGVIACLNVLRGRWLAVLAICIITTVITMVVAGYTVQLVKKGLKR